MPTQPDAFASLLEDVVRKISVARKWTRVEFDASAIKHPPSKRAIGPAVTVVAQPAKLHSRHSSVIATGTKHNGHIVAVVACGPCCLSFSADAARDVASVAARVPGPIDTLLVIVPPKTTANALANASLTILCDVARRVEFFTFAECCWLARPPLCAFPRDIHVADAAECAREAPHVPVHLYRRLLERDLVARFVGAEVGEVVACTVHNAIGPCTSLRVVVDADNEPFADACADNV